MTAEATGRRVEEELARIRVELAARAADATPLSDRTLLQRDVSRVVPLLRELLVAAADLLGTDMAAIWVTDAAGAELYPAVWVGLVDAHVRPLRIPVGTTSVGRAVAERRPVLVPDIELATDYGGFQRQALAHGVRAAFSVPMLTVAGEPMGTLTAYRRIPGEPGPRERRLVETLARQAGEMVERARMHAEATELARLERHRGRQLRELADTALALTSADSPEDLLPLVAEAAVRIVGCHQGVATRLRHGWADADTYVSLSERYAAWRSYDVVPKGRGVLEYVTRENRPLRLTGEQLRAHAEWRGLKDAPDHPPLPDYLAAPLVGRDGRNLGLLQLSHKTDESPFSEEDEAVLVQLAQMASSAIERLEALDGERAARREAEQQARLRGLLSDASAAFSASLEPSEVARRLVHAAVPNLAHLAVLRLVDEQGELHVAAVSATTRARERAARRWLECGPVDGGWSPATVLRTGRPYRLPELTDEVIDAMTRTAEQREALRLVGTAFVLVVPLTARGRTFGTLSLGRDSRYEDRDVQHALDLASRAALAHDNASRYTFERSVALTLQRSLLPDSLPASGAVTSASRYLPGARGTEIGGDWYDVLEVDGGLVLVVGDVMGRGVQAAAVMGQLRATVRAYAMEGHPPAQILTRLDRVVQSMDGVDFTTAVVGKLDPGTGRLSLASAGHLPPLLLVPGAEPSYVQLDPNLALGVGGARYVEQRVDLPPGATVLLYTDGLVEDVCRPIDAGLERLRTAAAGAVIDVDRLCDRLLRAMRRDGHSDDDIALLAVRLDDDPTRFAPAPLVLTLPAAPDSASRARRALTRLLAGSQPRELTYRAALMVTELVGNALRHASGPVRVRAELRAGGLRVEVCDETPALPVPREPSSDAEGGRGLRIVDALADRWGAEPLARGKRVWFELDRDRDQHDAHPVDSSSAGTPGGWKPNTWP